MYLIKNIGLCLLISLASCNQQGADEAAYTTKVLQLRANKNYFLMNDRQSPLTSEVKKAFPGLAYFQPDWQYKIPAKVIWNPAKAKPMPHTMGRTYEMFPVANLILTINKINLQLTAFTNNPNSDTLQLLVPFKDKTSGATTYEGGRYIDVILPAGATEAMLDFNMAYHPYCAYNPDYSCMIPPKENFIPIPIEAGEKLGNQPH